MPKENFYKVSLPKGYTEHPIFTDMDLMMETYDFLSYNSFGFMPNGLPGEWVNYETYIFSSLKGTIESIKMLLEAAHINDAFAVLRKYFDEIMIAVFYVVYCQDQITVNRDKLLYTVQKLKDWRDGKAKSPKYDAIIKYLKRSKSFSDLIGKFVFEKDKGFGKIRSYLDDNMHINRYILMLNNDNELHNDRRVMLLNRFHNYLNAVFSFHFASVIFTTPHYLTATYYRDCLESGETPKEGSQNWVASIAQEAFNKFIKPMPSIAEFLKKNTFLEIK
jgi:hypothetical protein